MLIEDALLVLLAEELATAEDVSVALTVTVAFAVASDVCVLEREGAAE